MAYFDSYDATRLAYHEYGSGPVLVCLPGGPARASRYLGDLAGLAEHRTLTRLDLRGTGDSAVPDDPATYHCGRLVDDVEALRRHLGLSRMDLLGHSGGAALAILYAARHPERLRRVVLVTPGLRVAGIDFDEEGFHAAVAKQSHRPGYPQAYAALTAWDAGEDTRENRARAAPFFYGVWDESVQALADAEFEQRAPDAADAYYAEGAYEPEQVRAALRGLPAEVLVLAGGADPAPTPAMCEEFVALLPKARLAIEPEAAHFPWLTHPRWFVDEVEGFLR